ncbi:pentapeptide repeat-containing protein [uncultured Sneathiella sp.]|jgi:hypothetical protein|uniref:pentapeptide repeat-containing protein n=1 Tax=uncultured Sneathiella sp. TaxID=879315 RepID=UPI0030DD50A1|tara:strand:+ start:1034 stop:2098 length:1065 start_codon:yes stop_codon:yes gene_type:complete
MADEELIKKIRDGTWKNPELQGADLSNANLENANLKSAALRGANLQAANLKAAHLDGLRTTGMHNVVDMHDIADMHGPILRGSDLRNADLRKADLQDAHLQGADLREADLQGVNLQRADLREADLRKADLRETNLAGANLDKIKLNKSKVTDETTIDLPEEYHITGGIILLRKEKSIVESGDETKQAEDKEAEFSDETAEFQDRVAESNIDTNKSAPTLKANPEDRIGYRGGKIPSGPALAAKNTSIAQLEKLRDELKEFHGNDEEFSAPPNSKEIPLSRDNLEVLKQSVQLSIIIHNFPSFPPEIVNALRELMLYLKSIANYLTGIKIEKYAALVTLVNQSWELIEKLLPMLS